MRMIQIKVWLNLLRKYQKVSFNLWLIFINEDGSNILECLVGRQRESARKMRGGGYWS